MKKRVLGKGLDALFPLPVSEGQPQQLDIDQLAPNPRQPRMHFNSAGLEDLAASIRENGIVQPIVVREQGERYEIVAGERRWRAAQKAGLLKVPVVVMEVADDKMLELALLENIQREDLNPVEEARAYKLLIEDQGLRQEDLARRLGKARTTITNAIRLLGLPEPIQVLLEESKLSAGQARPLLALADPATQAQLAGIVAARELSAREVERLVARMQQAAAAPRRQAAPDPHLIAAEERLCRRLGARVRIVAGKRGGQIVIHYASSDELDRLYETLNRIED